MKATNYVEKLVTELKIPVDDAARLAGYDRVYSLRAMLDDAGNWIGKRCPPSRLNLRAKAVYEARTNPQATMLVSGPKRHIEAIAEVLRERADLFSVDVEASRP